jgi:hypothetical protein
MNVNGFAAPRPSRESGNEKKVKKSKIAIDGALRTVHQLAEQQALSPHNLHNLAALVHAIAVHMPTFTSKQKREIQADIVSIKQKLVEKGNEKAEVTNEINLLLTALDKEKRDVEGSLYDDAFLELINPLLKDASDKATKIKLWAGEMKRAAQSEWKDIIELTTLLSSKYTKFDAKFDLLRSVVALSESQRSKLLIQMTSWFPPLAGDVYSYARDLFQGEVSKMIKSDRADVLIELAPLFQELTTIEDRHRLFIFIPPDFRNHIAKLTPLFQQLPEVEDKIILLNKIKDATAVQRAKMIEVVPLIRGSHATRMAMLLDSFSAIEEDKMKNLVELAPLFHEFPREMPLFYQDLLNQLVKDVLDLPLDQRAYLSQAVPLFRGIKSFKDWSDLLNTITEIPESRRKDVIDQVIPFVFEDTNVDVRILFLDDVCQSNAYLISLDRNELKEDPQAILHMLFIQFNTSVRERLRVQFVHEQGVDVGGISRQFICELFAEIKNKMKFKECENGLHRPELKRDKDGKFKPLSETDKTTLQELGHLMMFCLNSSESYPIGMLFDHAVFIALLQFVKREVTDLGKIEFNELFSIYEAMNYSEEDKKKIASIKACLQPLGKDTTDEMLMNLYAAVEGREAVERLDIDYRVAKIKEHYEKIQEVLRSQITEEILYPQLIPLIEISNAMRSAPFQDKIAWRLDEKRDIISPTEFAERLQGTVTRELIIEGLEFSNAIPKEMQVWIENWIQKASDQKIMQFLFAVTGATSLGNKNLSIKKSESTSADFPVCRFRTCFNQLEIPVNAITSEEGFGSILDATIAGKTHFTMD